MIVKVFILLVAATAVLGKPGRIVGGSEAALGEVAFMASIQDKNNVHVCGGSIISATQVLTSALCTEAAKPSDGRVVVGSVDLTMVQTNHKVKSFVVHPEYAVVDGIPINDIAILTVDPQIVFDGNTGRAFLPTQGYETPAGLVCTVAGWGTTSLGGPASDVLLKVDVPIISKTDCAAVYSNITALPANQICAGLPEGGADACERDTGGPLFENGVVYGLVSWGAGCGEAGIPGVYTEVAAYKDWINANLI